ncbi:hypothetical protein CCP4SC76_500008 [Gammaproteobacteria bacterium]
MLGMGFVLTQNEATKLFEKDVRNRDVVFPYLTGKEVNANPDHLTENWVINFFDWPLDHDHAPASYQGPVAADYLDCLSVIEQRVKPERTRIKDNGEFALRKPLPQRWWMYADKRPALYTKLESRGQAFAIATQATKYIAFAKVHRRTVFSHALALIVSDSWIIFATISSSFHDVWARAYGSYNLALLRYSPSDLFETFPFPLGHSEQLQHTGKQYYTIREETMLQRQEGLTSIYNRFHDPDEKSADIQKLRELHVEMDYAVAAAYAWQDLNLGHGFQETKQGLRYTINEASRREVLDRLLELNHQRYAEEVAAGLHDKKAHKAAGTGRGRKKKDTGAGSPANIEQQELL